MIVRIYDKDQATVSRIVAAAVVVALGVFAYIEMSTSLLLQPRPFPAQIPGMAYPDNWGQVVGVAIFAILAGVGYHVLNRPGIVAFLASVETELRKVSWPTKPQVFGSAAVVIITMLALGACLFLIDLGLGWVVKKVLGG